MALTSTIPIGAAIGFAIGQDIPVQFQMTPNQSIAGWTIVGQFLDLNGNLKFTHGIGTGIAVTDVNDGTWVSNFTNADTINLPAGQYQYILMRTDTNEVTPIQSVLVTLTNFYLP